MKVLITAASLVASLGGWAALTRESAQPATSNPTANPPAALALDPSSPTATVRNLPSSTALVLNLPPLPTVVPPPARLMASAGHSAVVNASAPAVAASDINPAAQAQPLLTLRVVNAPPPPPAQSHSQGPAPVAVTKSSRP